MQDQRDNENRQIREQMLDHPMLKRERNQLTAKYFKKSLPLVAVSAATGGANSGFLQSALSQSLTGRVDPKNTAKAAAGGAASAAALSAGMKLISARRKANRMMRLSHADKDLKELYVNEANKLDNMRKADREYALFDGKPVMEKDLKKHRQYVAKIQDVGSRQGNINMKREREKQKVAAYEDAIMEKAASMMY